MRWILNSTDRERVGQKPIYSQMVSTRRLFHKEDALVRYSISALTLSLSPLSVSKECFSWQGGRSLPMADILAAHSSWLSHVYHRIVATSSEFIFRTPFWVPSSAGKYFPCTRKLSSFVVSIDQCFCCFVFFFFLRISM